MIETPLLLLAQIRVALRMPAAVVRRVKAGPVFAVAGVLAMAGCAQSPQHFARHGKEYFPESIYGRASARMVADGQDVPKGGGHYLVGNPYTIAGRTYVPHEGRYTAVGLASWYGDAFHGRRTANGEIYDRNGITAAHPTMPLPSYARVTNLRNHRSMIVRVNDRGPYHTGRLMDLSAHAADALGFKSVGTAKVKVEYVGRASLEGSDDRKLLATLRDDGAPARLNDFAYSPTEVAEQRDLPPAAAPDRDEQRLAMRDEPVSYAPAQPQRIRSLAEEEQADAPTPPEPPQRLAMAEDFGPSAPLPTHPPLPPQRPFDLDTIPGADVPVSVARR
ncbi:septal ring lytic transglycosylase RlpA family protein [Rhodoblastus sp.]|uniref:septal ring lytic transglycosylase RlpA family protein n=1 Tax=Rhodoblastus sp. TaxID=1962975 RepID=UPI003F9C8A34